MAGTFGAKYKGLQTGPEDVWIETGTYHGHGVLAALAFGFKELHTIEVNPARYSELEVRHPSLCSDPRVRRWQASSREFLPKLIEGFTDRNVVFWLDAHYQGESQDERDSVSECPILDELEAISKAPWKGSVVVCIDDWNFFTDNYWSGGLGREKFTASDWPRETQLASVMAGWKSLNEDHILYFYR